MKKSRRNKWTAEQVIAEAKRHNTKSEWAKASSGSYHVAKQLGVWEECTAHMVCGLTKFTALKCWEIAKGYDSLTEFNAKEKPCRGAASKRGIYRLITAHMVTKTPNRNISNESIMRIAKKYDVLKDFRLQEENIYRLAWGRGILDAATSHMVKARREAFTFDEVKNLASDYQHIIDFEHNHKNAYERARSEGWLSSITAHMTPNPNYTDANVFYIWGDKNNTGVYKGGITSERCGERRIQICSGKHKTDAEIVLMLKTDKAKEIEEQFKTLGTDPEYSSDIDGYTEFRVLNDSELGQAVKIAYDMALAA